MSHRMYIQPDLITSRYKHMPLGTEETPATDWKAYGIALLVGVGLPALIMAATVGLKPNKRRHHKKMRRNDALHERIAEVLGWPVKDTYGFDLQSLREMVRHKSPKLAAEITERITSGSYIVGSRYKRKYRRNGGKASADPKMTLAQLKKDSMIRMVVGNYHVGTPDAEIEENFRARCAKAGYSKSFADKVVKAALHHHHQNRSLYGYVMGGMKHRTGGKMNSNRTLRANAQVIHQVSYVMERDTDTGKMVKKPVIGDTLYTDFLLIVGSNVKEWYHTDVPVTWKEARDRIFADKPMLRSMSPGWGKNEWMISVDPRDIKQNELSLAQGRNEPPRTLP